MIKIKTPATTANMGAGFDCVGMAFQLYNELTVEESDIFSITSEGGFEVPTTEDNLIYQTISRFYAEMGKKLPRLKLVQRDLIPFTRGLGSSAACIVSGLLAANELTGGNLSRDDLIQMASEIDGHPDNVAPAILGGLVVAATEPREVRYVKIAPSDDLSFVAFIPMFQVLTEAARQVLPNSYSRADVVFNVSRASLFIASMISGKWDNLNTAIDDKIHQPYRKALIPSMDVIFKIAKESGAKGVFLSGAGPTLIAVIMKRREQRFVTQIQARLNELNETWIAHVLHPDMHGAQIIRSEGLA